MEGTMSDKPPTDAELFDQLMQERIAYFRTMSQSSLANATSATKPNRRAAHMGLSMTYDELARITDVVRAQVVAQMKINQSFFESLLTTWKEIDHLSSKLTSLDTLRIKTIEETHEDAAKLQRQLAEQLKGIIDRASPPTPVDEEVPRPAKGPRAVR